MNLDQYFLSVFSNLSNEEKADLQRLATVNSAEFRDILNSMNTASQNMSQQAEKLREGSLNPIDRLFAHGVRERMRQSLLRLDLQSKVFMLLLKFALANGGIINPRVQPSYAPSFNFGPSQIGPYDFMRVEQMRSSSMGPSFINPGTILCHTTTSVVERRLPMREGTLGGGQGTAGVLGPHPLSHAPAGPIPISSMDASTEAAGLESGEGPSLTLALVSGQGVQRENENEDSNSNANVADKAIG